ncbi:MAG TPA: alpha/beta hydrolase [Acidimicrobiales bacterium]|nr:alpha/beta hydrolase [Acidimicrobiales bacterium]
MTSTLRPPFVVDRGRGAPVLFVHGQPGLGSDWDQVAAKLTDHRVLIVDRPGYGRSGEETLSIEGNAEILATLVIQRDAGPVTVVGHSYGGGVAIELAARRPDLVAGLVLVGSIGRAESLNMLDRLLAAPVMGEVLSAAGLFTLGQVLPRVRHLVGAQRHGALAWLRATLPDERYDRVSSARGRQVWRSFVAEQRTLVREIGAVESALASVRAPTVVVSGTWDVVVLPSVSVSIASSIAGSELVTVARTGHFVPRDAPDVVATAVRDVESRAKDKQAQQSEYDTPT